MNAHIMTYYDYLFRLYPIQQRLYLAEDGSLDREKTSNFKILEMERIANLGLPK